MVGLIRLMLSFLLVAPSVVLAQSAAEKVAADEVLHLNEEAVRLYRAGEFAQAEPLLQRALAIVERTVGPAHPEVAAALNNLAVVLKAMGDYAAARPLYERALAIDEAAYGPNHPEVATDLNNLAGLLKAMGDYAAARSLYERAVTILEQTLGPSHNTVATGLNNLALVLKVMGDYVGARPLYERALRIKEQALGPTHPEVAASLNNLAALLETMGDFAGARALYERALSIKEQALGPNHPDIATSLNNLAALLKTMGDYAAARPLYERALGIWGQVQGPNHPDVALGLNNLAALLMATGDTVTARELFERALAIREQALGPNHSDVATSLSNLAALLASVGDYAAARPLLERGLLIWEQALGPDHPDVAASLNTVAGLLKTTGDYARSRPLYERARRIYVAASRTNVNLDDEAQKGLESAGGRALRSYVELLAAIAREPALDPSSASAELDAFLAAEQARGGTVQRALANAGARAAAGDSATAILARQVQELRNRRQAVWKQLRHEYSQSPATATAARSTSLKQIAQQADRDLTEASERLLKAFPRYAELAAPEPIDLAAVQRLLRPNEALVSYFALKDRLLVWLVRPGQTPLYKDIEIKRSELVTEVSRLRASIEQGLSFRPFDVELAHKLYQRLLAPLEGRLVGVNHLLLVPDDVLLALLFGALVTRTDDGPYRTFAAFYKEGRPLAGELAGYAQLAWLAREYAITILPSATSLRGLRRGSRTPSVEGEPLIGFGDPVLRGRGWRRGGVMPGSRGPSVAINEVHGMVSLPGTRDELTAVAKALGADPQRALYLGARATEPVVMSLNSAGRLGNAQVIAFATHGLIAGEITDLRQPALVLTPPATPSEEDDGLLGLQDILGLRLVNTDWVVLSACNTAADDGSGEGLSGLARAFFFAGARSVLVSHWSVEDRATQTLMTEVFHRYAADKTLARAEAVRQGMLALMASAHGHTAYFAHPYAWAPFFLVGEGGGETFVERQMPDR